MKLFTTSITSPVGELRLFANGDGLVAVLWPDDDARRVHRLALESAAGEPDHPVLRTAASQLADYFAGRRREFNLPLAPLGTPFQQAAWAALRAIPYGETRSYAQQAQALGRPRAFRAVGGANRCNPLSIVVPCHRVVTAGGGLGGFAGGLEIKRFLLDLERAQGG